MEDQFLKPGERKLYDSCSDEEAEFAMDDQVYDCMMANRGSPETTEREAYSRIRERLGITDITKADTNVYYFSNHNFSPVKSARHRKDFKEPSSDKENAPSPGRNSSDEQNKIANKMDLTPRKLFVSESSPSRDSSTNNVETITINISCKTPDSTLKLVNSVNSAMTESCSRIASTIPISPNCGDNSTPRVTKMNETNSEIGKSLVKSRRKSKVTIPTHMVTRRTSKLLSQVPVVIRDLSSPTQTASNSLSYEKSKKTNIASG